MSYGNNSELFDAIREILGLKPLPMKGDNESTRKEAERFWMPSHTLGSPDGRINPKRRYG